MAKFVGSVQEFHHFIGPRIRNILNYWTRRHRNERNGICEFCNQHAELQSAHIRGRSRRSIIENVLSSHVRGNGQISCNISEVEIEILSAHEPTNKTFKFMALPQIEWVNY